MEISDFGFHSMKLRNHCFCFGILHRWVPEDYGRNYLKCSRFALTITEVRNSRSRFHSRGCIGVWSESFIWIQITFSFIWTYRRLIFCPKGICFRIYDHASRIIWCNISDNQVAKTLLSKYNESRTGILGFGVGFFLWFYVLIENFSLMETLTGVFRFHISFFNHIQEV